MPHRQLLCRMVEQPTCHAQVIANRYILMKFSLKNNRFVPAMARFLTIAVAFAAQDC